MHKRLHLLVVFLIVTVSAQAVQAMTLEESLALAYANNPQILAARQHVQVVDEKVSQAVSGFRPTIGATYNVGRQRSELNGGREVYGDSTTKALRIEQPIFRGGSTWAEYRSALEQVKTGQYVAMATEQQVLLQAATAHMDVMTNAALLELARHQEQVIGQQLASVKARFDAGDVTKTDVAQANARLSDAVTQVSAAQGALNTSQANYERVVGIRPDSPLRSPEKLPPLPLSLEDALEQARVANPQLLAAIYQAKASHYDIDAKLGALLPQVALVGTISRQDGVNGSGNGTSSLDQDKIGLEVAVPLYQSGAEYSRIREAKALSRQRAHEVMDQRMGIDESVSQTWQRLEVADATLRARADQIKAATLALEGVQREQQYGTRTVLDVLNAQQELFVARTQEVQAQRERILSAYGLCVALGQLTPVIAGFKVSMVNE